MHTPTYLPFSSVRFNHIRFLLLVSWLRRESGAVLPDVVGGVNIIDEVGIFLPYSLCVLYGDC